ncbi:MAG: YggS family pyridoxal phosphate-dependent enzyme [Planctomycetota bacterium]
MLESPLDTLECPESRDANTEEEKVIAISNTVTVRRRLSENLRRIRDRMESACDRARRDPAEVRIVAVTKYVELDVLRQALELGLVDLGESRAQQLNQRAGMIQESLDRRAALTGRRDRGIVRPCWHMVGHLQRNKIKQVVPWVELIHSVDSLRLAEDLHKQATKVGRVVDILLQVNTSAEKSKFGIAVGAVPHLVEHLLGWPGIRFCGLMTMGPLGANPNETRLCFERLRDVFEDLRSEGAVGEYFKHMSMGMSGDFEMAIEAGATMVRLGSALFQGLAKSKDAEDEAAP